MQSFYQLWNQGWGAELPTNAVPKMGDCLGTQPATNVPLGLRGWSPHFLTPLFSDDLSSSEMSYVQVWSHLSCSWVTTRPGQQLNWLSKAPRPELLLTVELSSRSVAAVGTAKEIHFLSTNLIFVGKYFRRLNSNEELDSLSLLGEFFFCDWLKKKNPALPDGFPRKFHHSVPLPHVTLLRA